MNTNYLQWASNNYAASAISSEQGFLSRKSIFNIFHLFISTLIQFRLLDLPPSFFFNFSLFSLSTSHETLGWEVKMLGLERITKLIFKNMKGRPKNGKGQAI